MRSRTRRILMLAVVAGGASLSLLIWSKLKLVTGVPRAVYAEPESAPRTATQPPSPKAEPERQTLVDDAASPQ